jgi:putative OPT family oligopeptide transporter
MKLVIGAISVLTLLVWLVPAVPVTFIGAVIVVVFGFFFATVSSRMVGLVGSSNNPVSGMTIATVLVATVLLKATGLVGTRGMVSAIAIASIVCIVTAIAGDTSQDLKTGYILGATPVKQQIGEIIGVVASALAIGGTLYLLDRAWTYGSQELPAPQASMMKMIVEGVMDGNLPWALLIAGACIAVIIELIGVPVLPFAIGIYLPIHLNACIMVGGVVRLALDKIKGKARREKVVSDGILFSSGMIAGEGIIGIALALVAIFGIGAKIDLAARFNLSPAFLTVSGLVLFAVSILVFLKATLWAKRNKASNFEEEVDE